MSGLRGCCACRPVDAYADEDSADRCQTVTSPSSGSTSSATGRPGYRGPPGGSAGRTSGYPSIAQTPATRCAKPGAEPSGNGSRSAAAGPRENRHRARVHRRAGRRARPRRGDPGPKAVRPTRRRDTVAATLRRALPRSLNGPGDDRSASRHPFQHRHSCPELDLAAVTCERTGECDGLRSQLADSFLRLGDGDDPLSTSAEASVRGDQDGVQGYREGDVQSVLGRDPVHKCPRRQQQGP